MSASGPLTAIELAALRAIAGAMIPPSAEYGVPGADDDRIFEDIVERAGPALPLIRGLLARLAAADPAPPESLARGALEARLQAEGGPPAQGLYAHIVQSYYRDDRVMRALDLEPRPPFPQGYPLEEGDWSLLEPVKARSPFWRKA